MKIIVIADDLTGAAEVAGAASSYGLSAEVQVGQFVASDADVIVIDADSRSQTAEAAFAKVYDLTLRTRALQADLIFKKVDSLLRGPVLAEVTAMRLAAGMKQCLLVCGNPRKRRTVTAGRIAVAQVPLQKTEFALDPEYPRWTDCVLELLNGEVKHCEVKHGEVKHGEGLRLGEHWQGSTHAGSLGTLLPGETSDATIAVGDVSSSADLDSHVQRWLGHRTTTLVAGGAEFFEALLRRVVHAVQHPAEDWNSATASNSLYAQSGNSLLVSGTRLGHCEGWNCVYVQPTKPLTASIAETRQVMKSFGRVAIRAADLADVSQSERVRLVTDVAAGVISTTDLNHVWIEGGRTASNLIREMRIQRLQTVAEVGDGVVVLTQTGQTKPTFIVKPGSYPWPPTLVNALSTAIENPWREVV